MVVNILKPEITIATASSAMNILGPTVYYRRSGQTARKKWRIMEEEVESTLRIAEEPTTYGYRRIWALIRNSGAHVNINTLMRIIRNHNLGSPYENTRTVQEKIASNSLKT